MQINPLGLQDGGQELGDLPLGSPLPITPGELPGNLLETENRDPIFLGSVEHPIGKLGVRGYLEVAGPSQLTMAVLEENKSVVVVTHSLLDMIQANVRAVSRQRQGDLSLIEEVEDVMKTRNWIQVDAVWKELLVRKAGDEVKVVDLDSGHGG